MCILTFFSIFGLFKTDDTVSEHSCYHDSKLQLCGWVCICECGLTVGGGVWEEYDEQIKEACECLQLCVCVRVHVRDNEIG